MTQSQQRRLLRLATARAQWLGSERHSVREIVLFVSAIEGQMRRLCDGAPLARVLDIVNELRAKEAA